jgi:hypothetical protein
MPNGKVRVEYLHQLTRAERSHYLSLGMLELPQGREAEFMSNPRTPFVDARNRQLELEVKHGSQA